MKIILLVTGIIISGNFFYGCNNLQKPDQVTDNQADTVNLDGNYKIEKGAVFYQGEEIKGTSPLSLRIE